MTTAQTWKELGVNLAAAGFPIIGKALAGYIPVIGPAINMFGGGEFIGGKVAEMLAAALGVEATPAAVSEAIASGPTLEINKTLQGVQDSAVAKFDALKAIAKVEVAGEVAIAKSNAETAITMARIDAASNNPIMSLYRPIMTATITLQVMTFGLGFFLSLFVWDNPETLNRMVASKDLLAWWFGLNLTLLGLHFYTRGKEREAALTGEPATGISGNTAKVVAAVRKPGR